MAAYYLMAQLPSLDGLGENAPLPITEERFLELCGRFLGEKAGRALAGLTLEPPREPEPTGSAVVDGWNAGERGLRLALGKARAERMKKPFEAGESGFSPETLKAARAAAEMEDPMEAERYLLAFRLSLLESLRPMDAFSEEAAFYYALRLKLLARARRFDTVAGQAAYQSIYDSILHGDRLEVLS